MAEQVKIHREHKGLSQEKLEKELTGVTRSNIAHLEQALRFPTKEQLKKICEYLDMPKEFLRANFEITIKELVGIRLSNFLQTVKINIFHDKLQQAEIVEGEYK